MKKALRILIIGILFFTATNMAPHRFYAAIYQINYVPQKKMVQITSRIFIDDLNDALKNEFQNRTFIGTEKETPEDVTLMKKYLAEKFRLTINGQQKTMNFISKELESNVVICYLSIKDIPTLNKIEVENSILTELFPEQQNIIQYANNGKKQSLLLTNQTTKGMLK